MNMPPCRFAPLLAAFLIPCACLHAGAPTAQDLDAALSRGDFSQYHTSVTAWLNERAAACAGEKAAADFNALVAESAFASALNHRELLARTGAKSVGDFAKAAPSNKEFLAWLMKNPAALEAYLGSDAPMGKKHAESLAVWKSIWQADPDSRDSLYLKLAIAASLEHPVPGKGWGGMGPIEPLARYQHFKAAHRKHELSPIFDTLTVWELRMVVDCQACDDDMAWVREMLRTFRPDLLERPVRMVSEVQYATADYGPEPRGFAKVLEVGGKCGPRAWFGRMICQAFGIPSVRATQPGHAAVGMKRPWDKQWVTVYGRGWDKTRTRDGEKGTDFTAEANARAHPDKYTAAIRLQWLASALTNAEQSKMVSTLAKTILLQMPKGKVAAPELQAEAESDESSEPATADAAQAGSKSAGVAEAPIGVAPGVLHFEAESCSSKSEASVHKCTAGGKQVNIPKRSKNSWVDYTVNAPEAGTYLIQVHVATPYSKQVIEVKSGTGVEQLGTIHLPNTKGLWQTTDPVEIQLNKGVQNVRLFAPFQRGLAIRWFELKRKPV
jgi:hypothetical protein